MSETQIDQLNKLGYTTVDLLNEQQVREIYQYFFEHFADQITQNGFSSSMQINASAYRRGVDEYIKDKFRPFIEQLLPDFDILFSNFLHKKAYSASEVGIHRDWTYVDEPQHTSYNLWVPLVDVDESNGMLYVLEGSHAVPHLPRATPFEEQEFTRVADMVYRLAKPVPLKAGQGILYHPGLIHYSRSNNTGEPRLALAMVCIPEGAAPIHYRATSSPGRFRKYHIDTDFYYKFVTDDPIALDEYSYEDVIDDHPDYKEELGLWLMQKSKADNKFPHTVADYYDRTTPGYLATYGRSIQAFRPKNEADLHEYVMRSVGMTDGMRILDAGCGVGGPAAYMAKKYKVDILGITISEKQAVIGNELLGKERLRGSVSLVVGDYHQMAAIAGANKFDRVLFLESLGHSHDPALAIRQAYSVLKPGGAVYIKDFFPFEKEDPMEAAKYQKVVDRINLAYNYNVLKLNEVLSALRRAGFEIGFIRKYDFADDITARAAFEDKFQIDLFGDMQEFRVAEWLEILCVKS